MKFTFLISFCCVSVFSLQAQLAANAGADREKCLNDTVLLNGTGLNPNDTGSYSWKRLSDQQIVSSNASFSVFLNTTGTLQYELKVEKKTYQGTSTSLDTVAVTVDPLPTISASNLAPLCFNQCPFNLTEGLKAKGMAGFDPSIVDSTLSYYSYSHPLHVVGGPAGHKPYFYSICSIYSNSQIPAMGYRDTLMIEYIDPKGCKATVPRPIRIYPTPVVNLGNYSTCQFDKVVLDNMIKVPVTSVRAGVIETFRCIEVPYGSGIDKSTIVSANSSTTPTTFELLAGDIAGDYVMEYCVKNASTGCKTCDTATVTFNPRVVPKMQNPLPFCVNDLPFSLNYFVIDSATGNAVNGGVWTCIEYNGSRDQTNPAVANKLNNSIRNDRFYPNSGTGRYMMKFIEPMCGGADSINLIVNGLPVLKLYLPDTVCADSVIDLTPASNYPGQGEWIGQGIDSGTFEIKTDFVSKSQTIDGPYRYIYKYKNPVTTCTNRDTTQVYFRNKPLYGLIHRPYKMNGQFYMDFRLDPLQYLDTTKSNIYWTLDANPLSRYYRNTAIPVKDSGTYKVYMLLQSQPCPVVDSFTITFDYHLTGVRPTLADAGKVYPNPFAERLNITSVKDSKYTLYDALGRVLCQFSLSAGESLSMDTSEYSEGMYLLEISNSIGQSFVVLRK